MHRTRKIERTIRAGFGVALALLAVIGIVSYLSVGGLTRSAAWVEHSHVVISVVDAMVANTVEAEAAQRGFVINADEGFARAYDQALGDTGALGDELRNLVADNPEQTARARALDAAISARLERSSEIMRLRRSAGFDAVLAYSTHGVRGAELQQQVRALAQQLRNAEQELLDQREQQARDSSELTRAVIIAGSLLAFACVVLALLAIHRELQARALAEADLRRFFNLALDIFVISGADGRWKQASAAVTQVLGYSVEEFMALGYMDMIHPDDHQKTLDAVEQQVRGGQPVMNFENRFRHKDGSWRVLSWRSMPQGDLMYASARDVTEAAAAANELREARDLLESRVEQRTGELADVNRTLRQSEHRFRALLENNADCISIVDAQGRCLYVSPSVETIEGYKKEELVGTIRTENAHPDDRPMLRDWLQRLLDNPGKPLPGIWRRRHKDGRWLWLEGISTNMLADPAVRGIVANYRDVTERVLNETRMREQLQRLALLSRITRAIGERQDLRSIFQVFVRTLEDEMPVDFCAVGLYEMGENQITVSCIGERSHGIATGLGLEFGTVLPIDENGLGRCVLGHLVYEPDITATQFDFPRRLAGGGLRSLVFAPLLVESQVFGVVICARRTAEAFTSGECEFLRQAAEHTALASHQARLYSAVQQAYDELRQTQQHVMQQERLRALGQMASGIAHDINNAISPVTLYTEALLEREPGLSERGRGQLEIIQRAVDDVAQTVARMGEFYRLREPQSALLPVDLNKLVPQVVGLTRARWSDMSQKGGTSIEVRQDLAPSLPTVAGVESQIRDALVNLVFNAVDAMPAGGEITIRTRAVPGARGDVAQLEVVDQGIGMDEETRRRCLEPFFTTKGTRGTGLGLAMVYGVAQRHGATLDIDSAPGRGTTIRLAFPPAVLTPAAPAREVAAPVGPRRILIVDDDPLLLKSLRDALESEGHDVTTASGGQAGIDTFRESVARGKPFPVVVTDLGMPHVDGRKVAAAVKTANAATFVVMLTGWGRRLVAEGDVPAGVDEVLSKPPRLAELRAALAAHP